jgi:Beta-lactamase
MGSGTAGPGRPSPPLADTIFDIELVTKVFTATLLCAMVEDGLVALDDPVQRYLPPAVELPTRGRPITLADGAHVAWPKTPHEMERFALPATAGSLAHGIARAPAQNSRDSRGSSPIGP